MKNVKRNFIGTMKVFFWLLREDLERLNARKILIGTVSFLISLAIWYFIFSRFF